MRCTYFEIKEGKDNKNQTFWAVRGMILNPPSPWFGEVVEAKFERRGENITLSPTKVSVEGDIVDVIESEKAVIHITEIMKVNFRSETMKACWENFYEKNKLILSIIKDWLDEKLETGILFFLSQLDPGDKFGFLEKASNKLILSKTNSIHGMLRKEQSALELLCFYHRGRGLTREQPLTHYAMISETKKGKLIIHYLPNFIGEVREFLFH